MLSFQNWSLKSINVIEQEYAIKTVCVCVSVCVRDTGRNNNLPAPAQSRFVQGPTPKSKAIVDAAQWEQKLNIFTKKHNDLQQ